MSAADAYTKEVHNQLKRYAAWLPTDHVAVGDVGQLQGNIFVPATNLKHFGISVNVVKDPNTRSTYKFMSSGAKEVAVNASARGVPASSGIGSSKLTIAFSSAHSVYFSLAKCVGQAIDDLVDLGNKILKLVVDRQWQLDYVVVTRVVTAGSATILQAERRGASIELEGDASGLPVADLLKVGASVKVKSQNSVGLSIVAESELTPLFSLGKVKYSFLGRVLGFKPSFSLNLARNSIRLKRFSSHVGAIPNVDFSSKIATKNDLVLNVRLPKYGNYVDIGDLLYLTAKTSVGKPPHSRAARVARPIDLGLATRVPRKRFLELVDKLSFVDLDKRATAGDFVTVNLTLPKSGENISLKPLVNLAVKAAQPKAGLNMSTDLSFDEVL
jgi:hypothetical protein